MRTCILVLQKMLLGIFKSISAVELPLMPNSCKKKSDCKFTSYLLPLSIEENIKRRRCKNEDAQQDMGILESLT